MRFIRWLKEAARKALIGLGVIALLSLFAALAPAGSAARQPRYLHDAEAHQCFAVFDHAEAGPEHVAVPCTAEVLRLAGRR